MAKRTRRKLKSERLTVSLDEDQKRLLDSASRDYRTSAATIIRWALDEYFGARESPAGRKDSGGPKAKSK